jgi:hypothetical protein
VTPEAAEIKETEPTPDAAPATPDVPPAAAASIPDAPDAPATPGAPQAKPTVARRLKRALARLGRRALMPVAIYVVCTGAYCATAGKQLAHQSSAVHFVYLADSLLHRTLALRGTPPDQNDWAMINVLTLKDGRQLKGAYVQGGPPTLFRTANGHEEDIPPENVVRNEPRYFVSFPPFPALLMMPGVAHSGLQFNDVLFTVLLAGIGPALLYMALRRLRETGRSKRTPYQDCLLTAVLAFGTVYFYSSVIGQVWYTAHVVGMALIGLYVFCSLDARRPIIAGLAVGCAYITRTPALLMFPLFVWEALRVSGAPMQGGLRKGLKGLKMGQAAKRLVLFGAPLTAIFAAACWYNYARFGSPLEFGHTYLQVQWQNRIQHYGLFNYEFLSRNLAAALVLLPRLLPTKPYLQVSWHGLSLLFTTPLFLYALWPRERNALQWPLWITIAFVAVPSLLYQNDGWVQFGYRFSNDYSLFLILLIAVSGRPLKKIAHVLVVWGILINLYGAMTFRYSQGGGPNGIQYYYNDSFFPSGWET